MYDALVNRITYQVPKRLKSAFLKTKEINETTWEGEKWNVGKRQMEYGTEMRCLPSRQTLQHQVRKTYQQFTGDTAKRLV
jgi:hypothetical protein